MTKLLLLVVLACLSLVHAADDLDLNRCGNIADNRSVYTDYYSPSNGHQVIQIYLTTYPGTKNYTWEDILADTYKWDAFDPEVNGTVEIYDESNIEGNDRPRWVEVSRRGGWSRSEGALPSLKIKFVNEDDDEYKNMDRLLLLKHPWDATRVLNKLSFEILQNVDNMASMYTQFVNFTVDGKPYGLYTMVEDLHKRFLDTHDLKKTSWLYKAESALWSPIRDKVYEMTDARYNKDAFELNWGIAGDAKDHSVLVNAYSQVWNANLDSRDVMNNTFNVDNFATWLAFQYLINSHDIGLSNYAIYAPKTSKTCFANTPIYMMNWDHDSAWWNYHAIVGFEYGKQYPASTFGMQYFWFIRPVRRFLQVPEYVELLKQKMAYLLAGPLSPTNIASITDTYKPIITPILSQAPDINNIAWGGNIETLAINIDALRDLPTKQMQEFAVTSVKPMPIGIFDRAADSDGSSLFFYWEKSFSLVNAPFFYEFAISADRLFTSPIVTYKTNNTFAAVPAASLAPASTYFWRVIVRDSANPNTIWMTALVNTTDAAGTSWGVAPFTTPATIGPLAAAKNVAITNTAAASGRTYATLDNTDASSATFGCSSDFITLPAGWSFAKNTPQVRADIASIGKAWGSNFLVLADGTRVNSQSGAIEEGFGEFSQHLVAKAVQGNVLAYNANCTLSRYFSRILITNAASDSVADVPVVLPSAPTTTGPIAPITTGTPSDSSSTGTPSDSSSTGTPSDSSSTGTPSSTTGAPSSTTGAAPTSAPNPTESPVGSSSSLVASLFVVFSVALFSLL